MASDAQEGEAQKIQIFPTSTNSITPFWRGLSLSLSFSLSLSHARTQMFYRLLFIIEYLYICLAEKYEREAKKYWDIFYKRHQDRVINNSFPYHYQLLITNTAFYHIIHVFLSSVFQR